MVVISRLWYMGANSTKLFEFVHDRYCVPSLLLIVIIKTQVLYKPIIIFIILTIKYEH